MHLFLTGFMGAGKTTVGSILADLMGRPFVDLDVLIETQRAMSITEIFEQEGEAEFRSLESAALRSLEGCRPTVVATGGGVVSVAENRTWMKANGVSIWLDVPFDALLARVGEDGLGSRPLFQSEAQARSLFVQRREEYGDADLRIEVLSSDSATDIAERIRDKLEDKQCDT
jgi:shikimate kinase